MIDDLEETPVTSSRCKLSGSLRWQAGGRSSKRVYIEFVEFLSKQTHTWAHTAHVREHIHTQPATRTISINARFSQQHGLTLVAATEVAGIRGALFSIRTSKNRDSSFFFFFFSIVEIRAVVILRYLPVLISL